MPSRYTGSEVWVERPPDGAIEVFAPVSAELARHWFQALYENPLLFSGILDHEGNVLGGNAPSIEGCGLRREEIVGRPFWEGGWWSPDPVLARRIRDLCVQVIASGESLRTTTHYFLGDGHRRWVDISLHPVTERLASGTAQTLIVATGMDITDMLSARADREDALALRAETMQRLTEAQDRDLARAEDAGREFRERLGLLAKAAVDMVGADTIDELTSIVFGVAFPVLGAWGGAIIVRDEDELLVYLSDQMEDSVRDKYERAPLDSPLPGRYVARTGERLLFPTRAAGLAFLPQMAQVYADTGRDAWAYVPLIRGKRLLGSLAVSWKDEREFSDDEVALIESIAGQCAQVIDRIRITQSDEENALQLLHMVESMQRSLLTQAPTKPMLDIASRYMPAAQMAQIGGDWYDAFSTATGSTLLIVGDVAGHDGDAAAGMAQLRNVLRGLAFEGDTGPARLLGRLDAAIAALGLEVLATVLVAEVDLAPSGPDHAVTVRWASAGHPPPIVRSPNGGVRAVDGRTGLLVGVDAQAERTEHTLILQPGAIMLFYTDGLVERRNQHLDEGVELLVESFISAVGESAAELCDAVLAAMVDTDPSDDVVALCVKFGQSADE